MKIISIDQPVKIHTSCSSHSLNDLSAPHQQQIQHIKLNVLFRLPC